VQDTVQADAGFVPCAPDRPFSAGDLLIVAGSPEALRRFVRDLADTRDAAQVAAKV
jgi:hypothetical protein